MAEIAWTQEAARWLHHIHDYIAEDNPQAAAKVIGGIFEKTQILRHYPEIGQKYRVEPEGEIRFCIMVITGLHTCCGHYKSSIF